jgi:hypothetical protein
LGHDGVVSDAQAREKYSKMKERKKDGEQGKQADVFGVGDAIDGILAC